MSGKRKFVMAIDQGTSSSRCVIFDQTGAVAASAQEEFPQVYPQPGWVEHDPEAIWRSVVSVCQNALQRCASPAIDGLGITNQRETTLVWNRDTGECLYNAIVWQDRRTASYCAELERHGNGPNVTQRTGLKLDPYFSASKIRWILDNVSGAKLQAEQGKLAFGTIDCFLLWRLTNGAVHATDATNASRTLLFNIHSQEWDMELLSLFGIPPAMLPDVMDCAADFGVTSDSHFGMSVPICGIAGDQQAALIGQTAFSPGMTKSTYGTGCFVLVNTGTDALQSQNNLLSTVAYRLEGTVHYGIEGSIFVAGSAIQWLRDALQVIESAAQCQAIAERTGVIKHVHMVPAFAGLGAPYWDAEARGAILGLSRDTGIDEIVTATLQAVAYQTRDLILSMTEDGVAPSTIRVDGGMVANNWFLQFLADVLQLPVERPTNIESTVLGAAYLAGLWCGHFASTEELAERWQRDALFEPVMEKVKSDRLYAGWLQAVSRVRTE